MPQSLKNISLKDFRKFLEYKGLKVIRTTGGHEVWSGKDLLRPVILQTHVDPVPEFIIRNNLHTLGSDKNELLGFLNSKKIKRK
jgi:predicted RNA binding protein YcfA (HicA-like mRNA interferase family)